MIDNRLKTFLILSQVLNYTKTAEFLHITQPAVSQHIKHLEKKYNTKLFLYKDKTLSLSKSGEILYNFLINVDSKSKEIEEIIGKDPNKNISLQFGTTLTIGDFLMPEILTEILKSEPNTKISMLVDNTETLLDKLKKGKIDFALVEGHFNKSKYNYFKLSDEKFIGVCSSKNKLAHNKLDLEEIFKERLLIREEGSGSREIFEHILYEHNLKMDSFSSLLELASIKAIKKLVEEDLGITFLYERAVKEELRKGSLKEIKLEDFSVKREFNFVFLKQSLKEEELFRWFKAIKPYIE